MVLFCRNISWYSQASLVYNITVLSYQNPVLLQKCLKFRSGLSTFTWTSRDEDITDCCCFIIRNNINTVHLNELCLHLYMLLTSRINVLIYYLMFKISEIVFGDVKKYFSVLIKYTSFYKLSSEKLVLWRHWLATFVFNSWMSRPAGLNVKWLQWKALKNTFFHIYTAFIFI